MCQGQPRDTIYINFVKLESPMLQAKFQDHRTSSSGEEDFQRFLPLYGRGGHLGHVTSIMSSDFHFLVPESFHTTFGSDRHCSF